MIKILIELMCFDCTENTHSPVATYMHITDWTDSPVGNSMMVVTVLSTLLWLTVMTVLKTLTAVIVLA